MSTTEQVEDYKIQKLQNMSVQARGGFKHYARPYDLVGAFLVIVKVETSQRFVSSYTHYQALPTHPPIIRRPGINSEQLVAPRPVITRYFR